MLTVGTDTDNLPNKYTVPSQLKMDRPIIIIFITKTDLNYTFPPFYGTENWTKHLELLPQLYRPCTTLQLCRRMNGFSFAGQIPLEDNFFQIYYLEASVMYFANQIGMYFHTNDKEQVTRQL